MNLKSNIDKQIDKYEYNNTKDLSDEIIIDILGSIKQIDFELSPLLDLILESIMENEDQTKKTQYFIKILKFYGFLNDDILKTRQKFYIINGRLSKKPFLKKKQRECIELLLKNYNVF